MRDEEFKQKLTEVADWEIPLDSEGSNQHLKLKKLARLQQQEDVEVNDTLSPRILNIKYCESSCEDCGKIVQGRRKEIQVYRNKSVCGLKEKCVNCGLHKDPYTKEFNLTGIEASIKWNRYAKGITSRYMKSTLLQPNLSLPQPNPQTVVYESDTERITNDSDIFHCDK